MTPQMHLRAAGAVIFLGLLGLSRDLWWAWQHAPYDRGGGWIFLGWLGFVGWRGGRKARPATAGLIIALGLGLISVVGELNVARHLAIAVLLGAWMPNLGARIVVILCSVAWWPALGWGVAQFVDGPFVLGVRCAILTVGVSSSVWWDRKHKTPEVTL